MQPKKYDSFTPKRATNIDGFFAKPGAERPRQPVFHSPSVKSQPQPGKLADMPRRSQPQPVLGSAAATPSATNYPLSGSARRRPGYIADNSDRSSAPKKQSKRSWRQIFRRSAFGLGALVLLIGVWFGFRFYKDIAKITGNNNPFSLLSVFHPVPLKNQDGRVNILVAGNSADDVGHNGGDLTDSIMVLSVNTKNNTALMLSVPRDLWVNIPGVGHSRINAAYPNGGMNKLQSVVQDNLGITIDYQVLVNYEAFKDLVNALGNISITIKSTDPRGIYDPNIDYQSKKCCVLAKYPNGQVTLNGQQALDLARARGDPLYPGAPNYPQVAYGFSNSDFDRTEHQRQMLVAIKDKSSQSSVIANPFKVASLIDAVGKNVKTNLQVNEIETLYTYMKKIDDNKIDSYNINSLQGKGTTMLTNYTTPDGQSVLVPSAGLDDFTDIQTQITKILTSDPITKEGATVVVLNGTDTVGLALAQEGKLARKGMTVSIADANANQSTNTLIDNSNGEMPNTLAYLKSQYQAAIVTNAPLTRAYPGADFILILGQSSVPKTTSPTTVH